MGKLSTHVLDTLHGTPASGVQLSLYRLDDKSSANPQRTLVKQTATNSDGRCDSPLLEGAAMQAGVYELDFAIGDYFAARNVPMPEPRFLDVVTLRFGIAAPQQNYHVPLVATPWTYSTYRGS